ncbi:histone-lysine N-methyltransferase family member SUVH2-like [Syzygium oleosum]|uniref:histone-lysine N-methyltransferase family member SUVH2-like n=1 Tax=Syzygium oleosum TaxID=219896 RepID=UPI0011D1B999|nr:histone-lysine N-methyltransferase family member SUVH2-like [Syzygium oleosum]XP_056173471.1 histone-lysine N-methyltransferase family member SUVH2-like [Syzygium oleosum]
MDSLIPFQDLNLLPDPPTSSSSSAPAATAHLVTPKVEPKTEPLDDPPPPPPPTQQPQPPPPPPPRQHRPQQAQQQEPQHFPEEPPSPPGEDSLYTEFHRVSELFRNAFAKGGRRCGGDVNVLDPDSRAIVPFNPEANNQLSVVVKPRISYKRSSELVRVTDLGLEDERYFRDLVRRTRMTFDGVRILSMAGESGGKRVRGDLIAASLMRNRGLWLNRDKRIVGSIPGICVGDIFFYRMELMVLGLHGQTQAGIDYLPASQSSNGEPIATSVIVSGGYEDDEDSGDVIIYTGHGGQDKFNRQCVHQKLEGGNLALERSMRYGIELRVIRGIRYDGGMTSKVYVYDGLYRIMDCWFDVGKSGFGVFKYKLVRIEGQPEMGSVMMRLAKSLRTSPLSVRPTGYLSLDMSMKKENVPVLLFNDIDTDNEPLYYEYLVRSVYPPFVHHQNGNGTGCECRSGCAEGCFCFLKNGGEFLYDQNGLLLKGKPIIFECGAFCKCPPTCRNRATQRGLKHRFEIFRSRETGWGVRSLNLIQAGAFVCEYAGVVLTRDQAQIFAMNGDTLIYPSRFPEKWEEWGDLSQIFPDYVRSLYPSAPPLDFAMDVSKMRNVACYISHSTKPNVLVQRVLYDHNNISFPHLMLFAMENIPPLTELSLDYGVSDEWTGKPLLLTEGSG